MTATNMKNKIGFVDKNVIGDLEELSNQYWKVVNLRIVYSSLFT